MATESKYLRISTNDLKERLKFEEEVSVFLTSSGLTVFGEIGKVGMYSAKIKKIYTSIKSLLKNPLISTDIKYEEDYDEDTMMLDIPKKDGLDVLIEEIIKCKNTNDNFTVNDDYYIELGNISDSTLSICRDNLINNDIDHNFYNVKKTQKNTFEKENSIDAIGRCIVIRNSQEEIVKFMSLVTGENLKVINNIELAYDDSTSVGLCILPYVTKGANGQSSATNQYNIAIESDHELFDKVLAANNKCDLIYKSRNSMYYSMKMYM